MVNNPYDITDLERTVEAEMGSFKPDELLDRDSDDFGLVVDTVAEGVHGTHMTEIEADAFSIPLPDGAESWEDVEFASEVLEEAEQEIADELNAKTSLPGQFMFETNEGFLDRQLTYRFPHGAHPEWEGTCMSRGDVDALVERLEDVRDRYNIIEVENLIDLVKQLPVCK